jgi:hypothetical protein
VQDELVSERKARPVLFEPFSYAPEVDLEPAALRMLAHLSNEVRSVAEGVADVLAILERDSIDEDMADENGNPLPRLLPVHVAGNLHRLALVSLELLAQRAEKTLEHVREQAR